MSFVPQSLDWPEDRAILFVHGIGDASTGQDGAFPLDALRGALGADADRFAIYLLNYDLINDWREQKTGLAGGIARLKQRVRDELANDADAETAATVAEYAGDVLWPVLSADMRLCLRDAFLAQLAQIQIDRGEAALARGDDPLDYQVSIVAHSLGCFHTYEGLWAAATEPAHQLQPRSDLFTLRSVTLMASPVQLIRTAVQPIRAFVPAAEQLATIAQPLAIPAETRNGKRTPCTNRFVAITGSHDPVGGHLFGRRQAWAYMDLPGQESIVHDQRVLGIASPAELRVALAARDVASAVAINDPHSWTAYVTAQADTLRGALLA